MIEWLGLENFRSFGDRSSAAIAPITLVYGPNSAGKSSLVKSLLLLKQSALESHGLGLRFDGPYVDLGSARAVSHRHSVDRLIRVSLGIGDFAIDGRKFDIELSFATGVDMPVHDRVEITVRSLDLEARVAFRRVGAGLSLLRLSDEDSARSFLDVVRAVSSTSYNLFETETPASVLLTAFDVDSMLPGPVAGRFASAGSSTLKRLSSAEWGSDERDWSSFSSAVLARFRETVGSISYLGPLRKPWSRSEPVLREGTLDGVGPSGEYSVNLLYRHPDLLQRVNASLDTLEAGYHLEITPLVPRSDDGVADILPEVLVPVLRHIESGVAISPADAGFGLSQLLPLLVESQLRKQYLICIEQPELHLHPRLQARVGTVLRNAVKGGNRNRYLIETHSEHLLLRLQSLIRQGLLDSDSVAVIYVDNQSFDETTGRYFQSLSSDMLQLRLSSRGDLLDPWPGGFFDERWDEMSVGPAGVSDG